jgi:hypothetical protein
MFKKILTFLCLLSLPFLSHGESVKKIEGFEVHYSVFNSSFISEQVAQAYKLTRGKDKAIINIAILQKQKDGSLKNVEAKVSGTQSDLIHKKTLSFQKVQEQQAIYYIAEFSFNHKETIYFKIDAKVDGRITPLHLDFNKALYVDGKD